MKGSALIFGLIALPTACLAQPGRLCAWGDNARGQRDVPAGLFVAAAAGAQHGLAVRPDGSLVAWGDNTSGQCLVPAGVFTAVAGGRAHSLALRADGTLAAWGTASLGECDVPPGRFNAIAAGSHHCLAIREDGTLAAWGYNFWGQCDVPPGTFTSIACGNHHSVARRSDGRILAWGLNASGQCDLPLAPGYSAVFAGSHFVLAIDQDGMLAGWGLNESGQLNFPAGVYAAAEGGYNHAVALTAQNAVLCRGEDLVGQSSPLALRASAVAAGDFFTMALTLDCNGNGVDDAADIAAGTSADCNGNGLPDECEVIEIVLRAQPGDRTAAPGQETVFAVECTAVGATFRWRHDGSPLTDGPRVAGSADARLTISDIRDSDAGGYDCVVTLGTCADLVSQAAELTVEANPCPADFDGDGFVDFFDIDAFVACFEGLECPPGRTPDFNRDGFVDFFDFDEFVSAFGIGC